MISFGEVGPLKLIVLTSNSQNWQLSRNMTDFATESPS